MTLCVSGPARVGFGGGVASPPGRRLLLGKLAKKNGAVRVAAPFFMMAVFLVAAYSAASNPGRTGCVCNGVTVAVSAGATCAPVIFSGLLPVSARTTT